MGKSDKQLKVTRSQVVFNQGRAMKTSKTNNVMNKIFSAPANHKMPDSKIQKRHRAHRDLKQLAETENLILLSYRRERVNRA